MARAGGWVNSLCLLRKVGSNGGLDSGDASKKGIDQPLILEVRARLF